jgi:hypothetical protein
MAQCNENGWLLASLCGVILISLQYLANVAILINEKLRRIIVYY